MWRRLATAADQQSILDSMMLLAFASQDDAWGTVDKHCSQSHDSLQRCTQVCVALPMRFPR